ncbi:MAG: phosphatidylglycerol lysyltransferase domain-containing protein [Erysipelotrichaceae bacterium]|nr:phosphatidylglycerol lysyltransferase domain-containing protein [Erysipelotrichaceae bacterium]
MDVDCLKPVVLSDFELINKYLKKTDYEESNHNIINMLIWMDFFKLYQWHDADMMILICEFKDVTFAYMPLCQRSDFIKAVDKIRQIFHELHKPVILNCYTKDYVRMLQEHDSLYRFAAYTDIDDYVYETEKLRTFSGKKLQKKRNNLNAFYNEYGERFTYEIIDQSNIEDCRDYLDDWREDYYDEYLVHESAGIERLFDNWNQLPVYGGLIRIDGCVRSFIIGSKLSSRMGQINVEKADEKIRGLYQAILKEFLLRNFMDLPYLNREDDMGKDNLRQAKMAYNPVFMIEKFIMKG